MKSRYLPAFFVAMILFGVTIFTAAALDDVRLVNAVKNRDIATVRILLKQKRSDPNAPDVDGTTPLIWAAHNGDSEIGKLLIAAGANIKATNRYGVNALVEAATLGDAAMMEALLKAGADPNFTYGSGETPLMLAARTGNLNAVKLLIDRGANVNGADEFKGYTPLMFAATENQPEVAKLLIERGAHVNAASRRFEFGELKSASGGALMERAEGGMTPLQYAAREGNVEVGRVLILAGADVNAPEPQHKFTPMLIAIYNGKYDFASLLMENGASINDGSLYMAIELRNMDTYSNRPNPPETDRTLTATDIVKMLVARGADPNLVFDKNPPQIQTQGTVTVPAGATPFYRAVKAADLTVMRMLLDKGANAGLAIKNGGTPLMLAAGGGPARAQEEEVVDKTCRADPVEVIKMILDAGADINAVNDQQNTAVHLAALRGNDKVVQYLASRGARLDIKNKQSKSPAEVAPKRTAELIAKLTNEAPKPDRPAVVARPVASAVSDFPEAPARYILEGNCTTCHTLERVKTKHYDKESWTGLIESMRDKRGGPKDLTDDQIQELSNYLSKNFGPLGQ
jgi:ankyrin repeat protein